MPRIKPKAERIKEINKLREIAEKIGDSLVNLKVTFYFLEKTEEVDLIFVQIY